MGTEICFSFLAVVFSIIAIIIAVARSGNRSLEDRLDRLTAQLRSMEEDLDEIYGRLEQESQSMELSKPAAEPKKGPIAPVTPPAPAPRSVPLSAVTPARQPVSRAVSWVIKPAQPVSPPPKPVAPPPAKAGAQSAQEEGVPDFLEVEEAEKQAAESSAKTPVPSQPSRLAREAANEPGRIAREAAKKPPVKRLSVEEKVVRFLIWVGAVALALTGAYLVKYSFDHHVLGPGVRLGIGAAFGLAMLGAGEWLRRQYDRIAQALTAAGVSVLFAVLLAGMHVEHLVPRGIGFALMAAVTALAVVLSLRQGPFVAILGLIGGFATPALVGSGEHAPGQLFSYLFVLELGLIAITRLRQWWWMTMLTLWGGYGWVVLWLVLFFDAAQKDAFYLGLFVLGSAGAFALAPKRPEGKDGALVVWSDLLRWFGAVVGLVLMAFLLHVSGFDVWDWAFMGLLGAGCVVLARLDRRTLGLPWVALGATTAMLLVWKFTGIASEDAGRYQWTLAALGAMYAVLGYAALWGSRQAGWFASLSVLSAVGYLILGYYTIPAVPFPHFWGWLCLALTAAYSLGAIPAYQRRDKIHGGNAALAALVAGAAAFVSLAIPIELQREWLPVAWAVLVPALAFLDLKLRISMLRAVMIALVTLVALWLLANPNVLSYPIGTTPVLNWILYGYGFPVVAFVLTGRLLRRNEQPLLADVVETLAAILAAALVGLEVRHYFHRESLSTGPALFIELGSYTAAGLIVCLSLVLLTRRSARPLMGGAIDLLLALTVAGVGVGGTILLANPLYNGAAAQDVGAGLILNSLLYVYGLPAALLAVLAWVFRRCGDPARARAAVVAAVGFLFVLVTLQVRHGFHPQNMLLTSEAAPDLIEWSTFAIAWLVLAGPLLEAGRRWKEWALAPCGQVISVMAVALGGIVLVLARNPLWIYQDLGTTVVFNWLLYVYGLPAVLLGIIAWNYRRSEEPARMRSAAVAAMGFLFVLVSLQVRHGFHIQNMLYTRDSVPNLIEWSTFVIAWLVLADVLLEAGRRWKDWALAPCGLVISFLAAALGMMILVLIQNPLTVYQDPGGQVVFNWLLYIYGLPMVLLAVTSWLWQRQGSTGSPQVMNLGVVIFLFVLVTLEVRQGFHSQDLLWTFQTWPDFIEWATVIIAWLVLGIGLLAIGPRGEAFGLPVSGLVITAVGVIGALSVLMIFMNPLWTHGDVGDRPLWNWLLYAYVVPAGLILVVARLLARQGRASATFFCGISALLLFFTYVNLAVRHFYHHPYLNEGEWGLSEMYSYSAAWVLFGVTLLVLGIVRRSQMLRWASLVVMGLAIVKVFAWDMAHLQDLYRVFSFLGLGLTLLVLAFLYQRFVFRHTAARDMEPQLNADERG